MVLQTKAGAGDVPGSSSATFLSLEKLQRPLTLVAGAAGSQALFLRALVLAKADLPRLAGVTLGRKGSIDGMATIHPPLTWEEACEGEILLIGYTVELLCTFVGEALALRLIRDQWPDASFVDEESGKEGNA